MIAKQRIATAALIGVSTYIGLFIVNFGVTLLPSNYAEAKQKEAVREASDKKLMASARSSGLSPSLHPEDIFKFLERQPALSAWYPVGSLPETDSYFCNEGYGLIKYRTDRLGLRNDDSVWSRLESAKPTILFVGDSFTHGACVEKKYTIPYVFGRLSRLNSINLGVSGNDPYEYAASLKLLVKPLVQRFDNIKMVALVLYANDNIDSGGKFQRMMRSSVAPLDAQALRNGDVKISSQYHQNIKLAADYVYSQKPREANPSSLAQRLKDYLFLRFLAARFRLAFARVLPTSPSFSNSPTAQAITRLADVCASQCSPVVIYIPNSNYWRPDGRSIQYRNSIREFAQVKGVRFVDVSPVIDQDSPSDFAPAGPHLSTAGYAEVGRFVHSSLQSVLVPGNPSE